jgi:ABC-type Fe3+/spermidine/putrescine transport system ATPase subunit
MASITSLRTASTRSAVATGPMAASGQLLSGDALTLSGVTRAFGALRAVDDVSLNVAAGQKYAILGSNGAGKTTLFNAITGDYPPTAGRIHFFGEDITALPPHERIRKGLRRTYQSSLLFRELSVRDNLFLAVRGVANGRFSFLRARAGHASTIATNDLLERTRLSHIADERGREPRARPATPARDRHGARRRAAPDPVRRTRRRALAGRAPRAGRAAALAARTHELRADRARPRHRAALRRARDRDAQRPGAEDRLA